MTIPAPITEAIEKMAAHLAKQRKMARVEGACTYRGDNDTKCAVGCLFSDEAYALAGYPEAVGVGDLMEDYPPVAEELAQYAEGDGLRFLMYCQNYHDCTSGGYMRVEYEDRLVEYEDRLVEYEDQSDEALAAAIKADLTDIARRIWQN